jgi:hypothetical protein
MAILELGILVVAAILVGSAMGAMRVRAPERLVTVLCVTSVLVLFLALSITRTTH